jgi:hypothetical protein
MRLRAIFSRKDEFRSGGGKQQQFEVTTISTCGATALECSLNECVSFVQEHGETARRKMRSKEASIRTGLRPKPVFNATDTGASAHTQPGHDHGTEAR